MGQSRGSEHSDWRSATEQLTVFRKLGDEALHACLPESYQWFQEASGISILYMKSRLREHDRCSLVQPRCPLLGRGTDRTPLWDQPPSEPLSPSPLPSPAATCVSMTDQSVPSSPPAPIGSTEDSQPDSPLYPLLPTLTPTSKAAADSKNTPQQTFIGTLQQRG